MAKNWLNTINYALGISAVLMILAALGLYCARPAEIAVVDEASFKATLPRNAFSLNKDAYNAIGEPFLALKFSPLSMQLPDLRKALVFFGKNGRPDAQMAKPLLHFAFNGNKSISTVTPGERLYVYYDKSLSPPQYAFSPKNEPTPLWIEADLADSEASVTVCMQVEEDKIIQEPSSYARFTLQPKEYAKFNSSHQTSEIGKWRVDGSLLARQKARWYGFDRFLEKHGGEEFSLLHGKQRIDFGEEDEIYSVFVGPSDCMIWSEDRWKVVSPGAESLGHPLMVLKKVDDRLMNFELWDAEGKNKVVLNLLKSSEPVATQSIDEDFRFVGARTRSQFVFEIDEERMLLRPKDWLVQTEEGWKKLSSAEEIDAYVERKLSGPLFVFDGIVRKDDKQVMVGTVFNASRTDIQVVELPLMQAGGSSPSSIENPHEDDENSYDNPVAQNHYKHHGTNFDDDDDEDDF